MPQDLSHQNLRGRSFRGQDLTCANFSHADIRGADFTKAILVGSNFSHAWAGQRYYWIAGLIASSLILAALGGFISAYAGALVGSLMVSNPEVYWFSVIALFVLAVFVFITVRQGLGAVLGAFALTVAVAVAVAAATGELDAIAAVMVQSVGIAGAIAGAVVGAIGVTVAWAMARGIAVSTTAAIALISAVPGALEGVGSLARDSQAVALVITGAITVILIGLSIYIGWRAIAGDKKFFLIRAIAITLSSLGGTSFQGADLTDADFTQATLKSADLRKAILTRTCWFQAHKLDQARIEGTYLENPQVRQLALTKDGRNKNYERLDLRDLNLKDANLQDASFIGTDFSEATLQSANLSGAKLAQAQLYKASLVGACLTGAYIQNWGISTDTKLEAVKCEYIYMQLPTKDDPDPCRKPDNRHETFKEGDFSDFIAPIIKTLDLYRSQNIDPREMASTFKTLDLFHYKGVDPTAAAVALKQLAEEYPEAGLEVAALEGRGNEKIRLQAVVAGNANRSELSAEYFAKYSQFKSLPYSDLQALLARMAERDEQIRRLERLLKDAQQQPKFYVETYHNQGEFIMSQSKGNVSISGTQGNVSGVAAAGESQTMTGVAIGAISGTVTNTINQIPDSPEPDKPGIKELLVQLQAAIEAEPELSDEDKVEALEQMKALAESGKNPEEGVLQKAAKTAIKILKGTVASLPSASKLVEECSKLLPAIAPLLGI